MTAIVYRGGLTGALVGGYTFPKGVPVECGDRKLCDKLLGRDDFTNAPKPKAPKTQESK